MCGSAALAGDINKASITTQEKLTVEGKTLNPGHYRVEWDGSGPNVQVKLIQGKDTVATFQAHVEQQQNKNVANAYSSEKSADGTRELTAIYVGGKHDVLQLQGNAANQQQSSNSGAAK
jgi:hypothetical protein